MVDEHAGAMVSGVAERLRCNGPAKDARINRRIKFSAL